MPPLALSKAIEKDFFKLCAFWPFMLETLGAGSLHWLKLYYYRACSYCIEALEDERRLMTPAPGSCTTSLFLRVRDILTSDIALYEAIRKSIGPEESSRAVLLPYRCSASPSISPVPWERSFSTRLLCAAKSRVLYDLPDLDCIDYCLSFWNDCFDFWVRDFPRAVAF